MVRCCQTTGDFCLWSVVSKVVASPHQRTTDHGPRTKRKMQPARTGESRVLGVGRVAVSDRFSGDLLRAWARLGPLSMRQFLANRLRQTVMPRLSPPRQPPN